MYNYPIKLFLESHQLLHPTHSKLDEFYLSILVSGSPDQPHVVGSGPQHHHAEEEAKKEKKTSQQDAWKWEWKWQSHQTSPTLSEFLGLLN